MKNPKTMAGTEANGNDKLDNETVIISSPDVNNKIKGYETSDFILSLYNFGQVEILYCNKLPKAKFLPVGRHLKKFLITNQIIPTGEHDEFFMPNLSHGPALGKQGITDETIYMFFSIFLDFDEENIKPESFHITPSAIIKREDDKGWHVYFFIFPTDNVKLWEKVQKAFIDYYTSDKAVKNPARWMRLPGSTRYKWDKSPDSPPMKYLIEKCENIRYTLEELLNSLPSSPYETKDKKEKDFSQETEEQDEEDHADGDENSKKKKKEKTFLWWKQSGERLITKTIEELQNAKKGERNTTLSLWAGRTFQKLDLDFWGDACKIFIETALKIGLELIEIEATLKSAQEFAQTKIEERQEKSIQDEKNKTKSIIEILQANWRFRRNIVTGKVEFKNVDDDNFQIFEDVHANSILTSIRNEKNISISKTHLIETIVSDFSPEFHPFKEAIKKLPTWDGVTDYIKQLANTLKVKSSDTTNWYLYLRRWLIALVGTMIEEAVNQSCLIIYSKQGEGKTKWCNNLVLPELEDYLFTGYLNIHDKDALIKASENYIINLDEMEGSLKNDWSFLKSLITMKKISVRRPYGHFDQVMKKHASFCGSIDKDSFLDDSAGTRRWLVVEAETIDYKHDPDLIRNVYSQAHTLFRQGEKYWFDKDEIDQINNNNEKFHVVCMEEELLLKYFEPISAEGLSEIKHYPSRHKEVMKMNTEIFHVLQVDYKGKLSERKLGTMLKKHGFIREKFEKLYRYAVKRIAV